MKGENLNDAAVADQLICYSAVAYCAKAVTDELYAEGLGFLSKDFGGRAGPEDAQIAQLNEEILRERIGKWHVYRGQQRWEAVGYVSPFIERVLANLSITREELFGPLRSESAKCAIASEPWGSEFIGGRSGSLVPGELASEASKEKDRESMELGIAPVDVPNTSGVRNCFLALLKDIGYRKVGVGPDGVLLVERKQNPQLRLGIMSSVIPGHSTTISINFLPKLNLNGASETLVAGFERGNYFDILEPFIGGFGRYRVARGPAQFGLQLYAYGKFFARVLPLLEEAVARCVVVTDSSGA